MSVAQPPINEQAVPSHLNTFLAIDFGLKRTGIAVGNRMMRTAQAVGSVHAEGDARFAQIALRLKVWQPDAIVIGVPYHPDGVAHENTARAKSLAANFMAVSLCRCLKWTSATPPPRHWPVAQRMPMHNRPASFWNSF